MRNLVRRLEHEEPGVSGSILEGLDEILTVIRLGLPHELRRSLACTNIVENALGTVRQVTRNVKRWRHAEMALRWTAAGLLEAQKTFRRLKAYRQLPILRNALQEHSRLVIARLDLDLGHILDELIQHPDHRPVHTLIEEQLLLCRWHLCMARAAPAGSATCTSEDSSDFDRSSEMGF